MRDDSLTDHNASPLNPLPGVVWLLILAVAGIEVVLSAAGFGLIGGAQGVGWRMVAIQEHGFSSALQDWMLDTRRFPPDTLARYLTFPFVHGAPMHAVLSVVMLAAMGKVLVPRLGTARFLVLALGVPVLAAMVFGLVVGQDRLGWLFGAMPMAFALVGAFTWLRWQEAPDAAARRRAFSPIAVLLAARLGFGLLAEAGPSWVADVSAFAFGLALTAGALGPGSWARTWARLRG